MEHKLITGPKGGNYWIDENGKKHYVPKKKSNKVNTLSSNINNNQKSSTKLSKMKCYIGYFKQLDESGETIDDFKEWVNASSKELATIYLKQRYSHDKLIKLDQVVEE